jgi:hypothetical protein
MITFKQYLLEFGDLSNLVTDDIELEKTQYGYEYKFGSYDIYMNYKPMKIRIGEWPNDDMLQILDRYDCYTIGLTHQREYDLTGKGNAFTVYKMLFKVMKKFMDEVKPKGLHFSGFVSEMDLLYNTFYKKYLASTFMKIKEFYLRRDVYETFPPEWKEHIKIAQTGNDLFLIRARKDKINTRLQYLQDKKVPTDINDIMGTAEKPIQPTNSTFGSI